MDGWMDAEGALIQTTLRLSGQFTVAAGYPIYKAIKSNFPRKCGLLFLQWQARISCTLGCNLVLSFCTEVVAKPMPNAFARL